MSQRKAEHRFMNIDRAWYAVSVLLLFLFFTHEQHDTVAATKETEKKIVGVEQLKKELNQLFLKQSPDNFFWGIRIESLDKNQVIYSLNAGKNFTPASNQKLVTVGAALKYLDTNFCYSTTVAMQGTLQATSQPERSLKGNLIVKSNGDPSINERWQNGNAIRFFEEVADGLLKLGIFKIDGDIIGDDGAFLASDVATDFCGGDGDYAGSWEWEDLGYAMASPASALAFNENMIRVEASPAQKPGKPPLVSTTFPTGYISIINRAVTGDRKADRTIRITRQLGTNNVLVTGTIPVGSSGISEPIGIERPAIFFLDMLKETLSKKGISVSGKVRRKGSCEVFSDDSLTLVARHYSPPLKRILEYINKESNNFSAEQVLRTIGKAVHNQASQKAGLDALQAYLVSLGVGQNAFYLKDASGLSRQNMLSPVALVTVLKSLYKSRAFSTFLNTLAIAGVDGTLEKRLVGTAAQGVVYGKTGYIAGVRTFSGYVKTADGEWVAVSMMAMNYTQPTREVQTFQDEALLLLANWKRN